MPSEPVRRIRDALRRPRRSPAKVAPRRYTTDDYERAEFACPYDNTPLIAPWERCPACGRND